MPVLTPGDAHDIVATWKRGWEARDPDLIVSLFRPDAEYRDDPFADQLVGANAIRARWNDIAATSAHVEFDAERVWAAAGTVLASWHAAYTRRPTAERVRARGFMTLEVDDDGLVWRFRQWPLERVVGIDRTLSFEE